MEETGLMRMVRKGFPEEVTAELRSIPAPTHLEIAVKVSLVNPGQRTASGSFPKLSEEDRLVSRSGSGGPS